MRKDRGKILGEIYILGDRICDMKVEMGLLGKREDQQGYGGREGEEYGRWISKNKTYMKMPFLCLLIKY